MIRINGNNDTRVTSSTAKSAESAPFRPTAQSSRGAEGAAGTMPEVQDPTPAAVMSALLELQSDGGGNAKTLVAAQRTLDLLDGLQMRLLEGAAGHSEIDALHKAAGVRAYAAADPQLQTIYDEISLRARVELAKLGR